MNPLQPASIVAAKVDGKRQHSELTPDPVETSNADQLRRYPGRADREPDQHAESDLAERECTQKPAESTSSPSTANVRKRATAGTIRPSFRPIDREALTDGRNTDVADDFLSEGSIGRIKMAAMSAAWTSMPSMRRARTPSLQRRSAASRCRAGGPAACSHVGGHEG